MIHSEPGIRSAGYISYFQSPWHVWFREMGYPQLDINRFKDGEWEIIEYHSSPVVPALTKYHTVLSGLRNIEITKSFVEKYVAQLDVTKRAFWEREEAKSRKADEDAQAKDRHADEFATRASHAIVQNPDLMERIATKGIGEMDITKIASHIPRSRI
jgi:hypothetical protein